MPTPSKRAGPRSGWRLWTRVAVVATVIAGTVLTFAQSSSAASQSAGSAAARSERVAATAALPLCTIDRYLDKDAGNREGIILPAARNGTARGNTSCVIGDGLVGCEGCSGIAALQRALNDCNRGGRKGIPEDGTWGPTTKAALKAAQRDLGLDDDGVYGPATRDAMKWKTLNDCLRLQSKK
jgi:peptidoglycan hydrolase-like protein with peptidoglycan-binding domain